MSTSSYDEIRQQIERRYRRRSYFIYHVIIAIAGLSTISVMSKGDNTFEEVMAALWFGLLVLHGVKVVMDEARDRAIERTWRRYYGEFDNEKPKRTLRLMDDAELEVVEEDLPERKYMRRE